MMATYEWDDVVYVSGLQGRPDLNNRAARVCNPTARADRRIGVELFIGQERVWIKRTNLTPIPNMETLSNPPFNGMSLAETTDVGMFFLANEGSARIPGFPGRVMTTRRDPPAPEEKKCAEINHGLRRSQVLARNVGIENDIVYACSICGAHRPIGYRCCGRYAGMNGEQQVQRRNIHDNPDADEDEVDDFLLATITRLDREGATS